MFLSLKELNDSIDGIYIDLWKVFDFVTFYKYASVMYEYWHTDPL